MSNGIDTHAALLALESMARGHVRISALRGGTFTLPTKLFVANVSDEEKKVVPSLSFLIIHRSSHDGHEKRLLFDLGLRRNTDTYTLPIQNHLQNRLPMELLPDVKQSLEENGLSTEAIDQVILSHVHWDHIGTPSDYPRARFLVGAGSLELLSSGLNDHLSHSNFQHDLFNGLDVSELPYPEALEGGWQHRGGLMMLDLSGNGVIYVVDSPGHLTGHIALLVRRGERRWVLLVGDACHDSRLLSGECDIAEWTDQDGRLCCIHTDKHAAAKTLAIFMEWKKASEECDIHLQIIFAHDEEWAKSHPGAFFPGSL